MMTVSTNLRDKRALVLRLIMAEALAKPGQGPLAPRFGLLTAGLRPRRKQALKTAVKDPTP